MMNKKFETGSLYITATVKNKMDKNEDFLKEVYLSLSRYRNCDWGDLTAEDAELNNFAIDNNGRIFAAYNTNCGKIYIITESDRSVTTILFEDEY